MDKSQPAISKVIILSDSDDKEIEEKDEIDEKLLQCLQQFNGDLSLVCKKYPEFNKRDSYRKLKTYLQTIRGCEKLATFFNNPSIRQAASVEDLLQAIDTTTPFTFNGLRVKKEFKKKEEEEEDEEEEEEVQEHKQEREKAQKELGKEDQVLLRKQMTQEQESKCLKLFEDEMRRRELNYHAEMEERRKFEEEMYSLYKQQHIIEEQTTLEYARAVASNTEVTETLQLATADLEKAQKSLTDALKDNKRAEASMKRITEIVTAFEARESKVDEDDQKAVIDVEKGTREKKAGTRKTTPSSASKSTFTLRSSKK